MWTLPWQECEDKVAIFKSLEQKMEIYLHRVWKYIKKYATIENCHKHEVEIYSNRIWKSIWTEMQKGEDERKLP